MNSPARKPRLMSFFQPGHLEDIVILCRDIRREWNLGASSKFSGPLFLKLRHHPPSGWKYSGDGGMTHIASFMVRYVQVLIFLPDLGGRIWGYILLQRRMTRKPRRQNMIRALSAGEGA